MKREGEMWIAWKMKLAVFMLLTVNLSMLKSDVLEPCFRPSPGRLIINEYHNQEKWFKSGQIHSYCMHKFVNSVDYNECISVCGKPDKKKELINCTRECRTSTCKTGCKFYDDIFNNKDNSTLDSKQMPSPKPIDFHVVKNNDNVTLNWEDVLSKGRSNVTTTYLVTVLDFDGGNSLPSEYILGLTGSPFYTVTTTDMCKHLYRDKFKIQHLGIKIKVYPINFNGPSNLEDSKKNRLVFTSDATGPHKIAPIKGNLSYNRPYFKKKGDSDTIVWGMTWESRDIDARSMGVACKYEIKSCETSDRKNRILENNLENLSKDFHDEQAKGLCFINITNTEDDALDTCEIEVFASIKYGECFLSDPITKVIPYTGCETVKDYPCVRPPTVPPQIDTSLKNVKLSPPDHTCHETKIVPKVCPDDADSQCYYCTNPLFRIKISWNTSDIPYPVRSITVRWGTLSGRNFLSQSNRTTLSPNTTNYTIYIATKEQLHLGVQVHAETNHSKTGWKFNAPVTKLKLELPKEEYRDATKTYSKYVVMSVALAAIIAIAIAGIAWKIHRRHSMNDNSSISDTVFMTPEMEEAFINDEWEINPHHIKTIEPIGEGAFGRVFSATVNTSSILKSRFSKQCGGELLLSDKTKTAVKFLKEGAQDEEIEDFKEEIALMKGIGYHKNIVNIIGCCTTRPPLCLIVEFMRKGNLLNYLRDERNKLINKAEVDNSSEFISIDDMMSFAWQISNGMEYLETKNIVHRDLAARNLLVGHNNLVKISDFGLSRQNTNEPIYISQNTSRKIPLKWMSVEAIFHKEFTSASDVWSYGVVLFEIATLGGTPYPFIDNRELCKLLKSGYRMEKPENCSQEMYDIMCHCWNAIPAQRPTFTELREHFEETMGKGDRYFSFEIDNTKAYYNVASFKSIPSDDEEDILPEDFDRKQGQVKPLESVKAVDVAVCLDYENKSEQTEEYTDDNDTSRYISPRSIKSELGSPSSYDNPSFHFNE